MKWREGEEAKALLIRPRRDKHGKDVEDYWLYVFDPRSYHAMAAKEIGVPWRRVVASLLIEESGAYQGSGCEEHEAVIARLDRRLRHEPGQWRDFFDAEPPAG
jgi:hypothetical protein